MDVQSARADRVPLSVAIITYNEAHNIRRCLESVAWASEIVVFDSGSTDETVAICRQYTPRVQVTDWPGFGVQKNRAIAACQGEWILVVDADEVVSPALQADIMQRLNHNPPPAANAFILPRVSMFMNRPIRFGDWGKDAVTRLFRRGTAHYSEEVVHETLQVTGAVERLRQPLLHYTVDRLETSLRKMDQYSTLNAQKLIAKGRKASLTQACLHGLWTWVRAYIVKLGFLDGRRGFLIALLTAEGSFYKYAKTAMHQEGGH